MNLNNKNNEKRLSVRLNEGQYRSFKNFAEYYNMTDSAFMRKCLRINDISENQEFSIINEKVTEITPKEVKQGVCTLNEYYYTKEHKEEVEIHRRHISRYCDTNNVIVYLGNGLKVFINGEEYYSADKNDLMEHGYFGNEEDYFLINRNKVHYDSEGHIVNWDNAVIEIPCREQEWMEEYNKLLEPDTTIQEEPADIKDFISIDEELPFR